jgi:hypothetical protein
MLDISNAVKAKIENISQKNLNKAKQMCSLASNQLKKASENNSHEMLSEGISFYMDAIQLYSRLTEPYLALAYLAWQMEQPEDALKLLNKVLEIESFNEPAQIMKKEIIDEIRQRKISAVVGKHSGKSLSQALKGKDKEKNDIFSKLFKIFSLKPVIKVPSKKVIANTGNTISTNFAKPVEGRPGNEKGENFYNLVEQSRKKMYD